MKLLQNKRKEQKVHALETLHRIYAWAARFKNKKNTEIENIKLVDAGR